MEDCGARFNSACTPLSRTANGGYACEVKVIVTVVLAALLLIAPIALAPMSGPAIAHAMLEDDVALSPVWAKHSMLCCAKASLSKAPLSKAPVCQPDGTLYVTTPAYMRAMKGRGGWLIVSRLAVAFGIGVPHGPPRVV